MTTENPNPAVTHQIIEIGGDRLVAEIDPSGEIVKTWAASENSAQFIAPIPSQPDPKP